MKTPGVLNSPPPQAAFDELPLRQWIQEVRGVFYRLHTLNPLTGHPWHPIHFSRKGRSRFDPQDGLGTLYLADSLSGALMEVFDDRWGSVTETTRSLTEFELQQWWVTRVVVPEIFVFAASGPNLSMIGTDMQLLTGDHAVARDWALRLMRHPTRTYGIQYPSRHDPSRHNLALYDYPALSPPQFDPDLPETGDPKGSLDKTTASRRLVYGPATLLAHHSDLEPSLSQLQVAILP